MPSTNPTQSEFESKTNNLDAQIGEANIRISQLRQDFDAEMLRINAKFETATSDIAILENRLDGHEARIAALEGSEPSPPPPPGTHTIRIDSGGHGDDRWAADRNGNIVDKRGTPIGAFGVPWEYERYGSILRYRFETDGAGTVSIHTAEAWGPNIALGGRRMDFDIELGSGGVSGTGMLGVNPQEDFGPNKPGVYQLEFEGNFELVISAAMDSIDPAACVYGVEVSSSLPVELVGETSPSPPPPPPPPTNGPGPSPGAVVITPGNLDHLNDGEIILQGDFRGLTHRPRPGQRIWLDGTFDGNGQAFMFREKPGGWDVLGVPNSDSQVYNYGRSGSQRAVIDFKDPDWPHAGRYDVGKCGEVANFTIRDIKGEALHYGGVDGHFHHMQLLRSAGGVLVAGWGKGHILEDSTLVGGGVVGSPGHESGNAKLFAGADYIVRRLTVKGAQGPGLWFDGMCIDPIIEDIVVKDCTGPGIFLEIGFGGTVRNVLCERTNTSWGGAFGGAAFAISMNDKTTLEDCTAKDSNGAVIVTYQPFRQDDFSHYPRYITDYAGRSKFSVNNVKVRNFINNNSGQIGAGHDGGSPPSVLDTVSFENTTMLGNARWVNKRPGWT